MSFDAVHLPDASKLELCQSLMDEFGINVSRVSDEGEMIHSCALPFGQHANGDAKPSASLNYKKLTFRCLGCGASGGLLFFICALRGQDAPEAREWLGGRTGLSGAAMGLDDLLALLDNIVAGSAQARPTLPTYDPSVLNRWRWNGQHGYLTEDRDIPEENLERFGVGYAPEYFDKTERIIIPHWWAGELVGWQARQLYPWDKPKYKNSPDFPRDRTFFNDAYDTRDSCVLVESPMSVLRHIHHVPDMIASFGAAISEQQFRLLCKHKRVTIWLDNDEAGWTSTERLVEPLSRYASVFVVESRWKADPAEIGDSEVDNLIKSAIPHSIWDAPQPEELITW